MTDEKKSRTWEKILLFGFVACIVLYILFFTWLAIENMFFLEVTETDPLVIQLEVTELLVVESAKGKELVGVKMASHSERGDYMFKYPRREHGPEYSLAGWFGDEFAKRQFRFGEKFVASCPRKEYKYVLFPTAKRVLGDCTVQ